MHKISVIIPVYNAEKTLSHCIESILCQTYSNFELLLIDDCSTDNSRQIIVYYSKNDKRINYLFMDKNCGVSETRNNGLNLAEGAYVMFVDSDDYVEPNWIECIYNASMENLDSFVMSNIYDSKNGNNIPRLRNKYNVTSEIEFFSLFSDFHLDGYLFNKIFDHSVIKSNNLRFNTKYKGGEDVDFIFRYLHLIKVSKFYLIEKPLYYYWRDNESSITHSYNPNTLEDNLHCFENRLPYISKRYIPEYCDIYFSFLYNLFDNVFDKRSKKNFFHAMRYNNRIIKSSAFRYCVEHSNHIYSKSIIMKVVRCYNYYLLWIFQRILFMINKTK